MAYEKNLHQFHGQFPNSLEELTILLPYLIYKDPMYGIDLV